MRRRSYGTAQNGAASRTLRAVFPVLSVAVSFGILLFSDWVGQPSTIPTAHDEVGRVSSPPGYGTAGFVVDGCMVCKSRGVARINEVSAPPPTGLVVSLIHAISVDNARRRRWYACSMIPSQIAHLIEPHGMDLLILLSGGLVALDDVAKCLNLIPVTEKTGATKVTTWENLDGSKLVTYHFRTARSWVYLAELSLAWPNYLGRDGKITSALEPMDPPECTAPFDYVQSTRFYTNEMLHLSLLSQYDYWIKLDLDIVFNRTVPFHMLHDMRLRGAVFGHTAEFEWGDASCSMGIGEAVESFTAGVAADRKHDSTGWARRRRWTSPCSTGVGAFDREADQYYSNFVIGETAFWQSEPVLQFARFLTNYQPGFFKYRWTDQIFYHKAMGLLIGPDFTACVADYTDLRCAPQPNCWQSSWKNQDRCDNGGAFLHTKNARIWTWGWNRNVSVRPLFRGNIPYDSSYNHDCFKGETRKGIYSRG